MRKKRVNKRNIRIFSMLIILLTLFFVNTNTTYAKINVVGDIENFDYTGTVQEFVAPLSGYYQLEVWGAQGGNATIESNSPIKSLPTSYAGGYGGYSTGVVYLKKNQKIYVVVGGAGLTTSRGIYASGGYNGGGSTGAGTLTDVVASGGGATHIAINDNLGELKNYINKKADILIVAGGGGGAKGIIDGGTSKYTLGDGVPGAGYTSPQGDKFYEITVKNGSSSAVSSAVKPSSAGGAII